MGRTEPTSSSSNSAARPVKKCLPAALIFVALGAATLAQPHSAWAQATSAEAVRRYDVPAGPLHQALGRFGREAGVMLSYSSELVEGRTSPGLRGEYTVEAGLRALLAGAGLEAVLQANGGYLLKPAAAAAVTQDSSTLPAITVNGQGEVDATSDGTGSYAAKAASLFMGARSLREIPQSVSVLTRQQMDDQGITRLGEALTQMPGTRLNGFSDTEGALVRGFGAGEEVDGVPQQGIGFQMDPAIYDRIEMIRGPAGLLSGSGEPGGVINYVRKRPKDHFAMSGNLSLGSWNDRRAEVDVGGPLNASGTLRGRMVGVWQGQNEYYDVGREKRRVLYGLLEYDLTPRDMVTLAATRMEVLKNRNWGLPRYSDGSLPGRSAYVGSDRESPVNIDELMLEYQHRFDNGWKAKATFTRRQEDNTQRSVWGAGVLNPLTNMGDVYTLYTHEIDTYKGVNVSLGGPFELFGRTHTATVGFSRSEYFRNYLAYNLQTFTNQASLDRHDWGSALDVNDPGRRYEKIVQRGFYGSTNFKLADPLTLVLGARISDYESTTRQYTSTEWVTNPEAAKGRVTPYSGLIYDLNHQWSVYGSYAGIFVPQSGKVYQGGAIAPRTGEQLELGTKGSLLDGRLNVSLAVFQLRDRNRSVSDDDPTHICPDSDSGACSRAAGLVQSRGWETEITGNVTPAWSLSASYTYNRTVYLQDGNPANNGKDVDPAINPRHLVKLWSQYRFSDSGFGSDWSKWTVGGGMIGQSGIYRDLTVNSSTGVQRFRQGAYAIFNAKVGYEISKNLRATLDINNLFNKTYLTQMGYAAFWNIYGDPRSVRLNLNYKFD